MLLSKKEINIFFQGRNKIGIKPGLDRMEKMLNMIGNPETEVSSIHVAGTNGKGSVIQFIETALIENGYTTGVFTSPSFTGLEGHFLIEGQAMKETEFISVFNQVFTSIQTLDKQGEAPTTFEILTVMSFLYFKQHVDVAIIETGMGGRFDTTNVVTPFLSVITTISFDHMQYLGNSLAEIAWQKAGIIKVGTPVVIGNIEDSGSREVFEKESNKKDASIYRLFDAFSYELGSDSQHFRWLSETHQTNLSIRMRGNHQIENAAVAYQALLIAKQHGFLLKETAIQKAFTHAVLPGRFEIIQQHPPIVLDSAHNVKAIETFVETLQSVFPGFHKKVLFAGFQDKQLEKMINIVEQVTDSITLTTFDHSRAATKQEYQKWMEQTHHPFIQNWKEAVRVIQDAPKEENTVYAVTGSLHFITYVRAFYTSLK